MSCYMPIIYGTLTFRAAICHNRSMADNDCRVRLKLPSGAEMEVQGPHDFVKGETQELLARIQPGERGERARAAAPWGAGAIEGSADWKSLIDARGGDLILRAKLSEGPLAAGLLLILGSERLLGQPRPIATRLARWIRASGYQVGRVDRLLGAAVRSGEILASGNKRARRYELSAAGKSKALEAAQALQELISKAG